MGVKRWDVTVELAKRFDLKTFAEIGVKDGKHVAEILRRVPQSTVVAVDPWASWSLPDPLDAEAKFDKMAAQFPDRLRKFKMTGVEAAPLFLDSAFDFVFIDDSHEYEVTKANIEAWLPKVCYGGVIAGHDYRHGFPGVDKAVSEVFAGIDVQMEADSVWWVPC